MKQARPKKFSGFKIGTRINVLAAIAVIATAVLSASYFVGDRFTAQALHDQTQFDRQAKLALEVKTGALQMRRREKDFLLRKDPKYVAEYVADTGKVELALGALGGLSVALPVSKNVESLKAGIARHKAQLLKVVELHETIGLNEKEGLQGQLRTAVHGVETKLKAADLDKLTVKMLMMRRHEKDFMLRGAEKYIGRIDERRAEFDALLREVTLWDQDKTELSTLMDAYQSGIHAFAKTALAMKSEIKELSRIFADMAPDFDAVVEAASAGQKEAEASLAATKDLSKRAFLGTAALVLVLAAGLGFLIGRSIARPVRNLTAAMGKLAEGDTSVDIPATGAKNEIGDMARAVEVFKESEIRNTALEAEQEELERRAEEDKRATMNKLADDFEVSVGGIVETLSSASTELNATAQSMSGISEETSNQATSVAAASEQTSSNVQTVASATEELSSSVSEINAQLAAATAASSKAVQDVSTTATQMNSLSRTAEKIGEVVSMISDIAEQTNLLALNATIESARAGEAGKGFAVVANEVKSLANESAKATEGIAQLIQEIQTETRQAVASIDNIGTVIKQLEETSTGIAAAMEQQGATTQEIARNVQDAASGAREVTASIRGVTDASVQAGAASSQVASAVDGLSKQADLMRTEVEKFLAHVRAA